VLLVGDGVKNRSTAYQPLRGTNKSEYHDAVITLGRDEPSVRDAEQRAMAIWYDTKEPIGCIPEVPVRVNYRKRVRHYLMRNGGTKGAEVSVCSSGTDATNRFAGTRCVSISRKSWRQARPS